MLKTTIWDLKMLTFIDGEPLKARLLLRGSTVCVCTVTGITQLLELDQENSIYSISFCNLNTFVAVKS